MVESTSPLRQMDSLTQATLGAAVAFAGWHRPLGRWSLAWGAGLGTLPDLDVLASPWLDQVQRLYWHRGLSHGVLALVAGTFLAGVLVRWVHRNRPLSRTRAYVVAAAIFMTHVAIDLFTVYGTQILSPFSNHGFGTNNLFIIDPLYTGPLLLGVVAALCMGPAHWRVRANVVGLAVSSAYVGWSFVAQARAEAVFAQALTQQGVAPTRSITSATALNTVLWRHLAAVDGGFLIGYWSWRDADEEVRFTFVPQRAELVDTMADDRAVEVVRWFSQGYWIAEPVAGGVQVSDLRFGELRPEPGAPPGTWSYIFSWRVGPGADDPSGLEPLPPDFAGRGDAFAQVWRRLRGDRTGW